MGAVALSNWVPARAEPGVSDGEIVIGQSCTLSGPLAPLAMEMRQGATWYIEQVNAKEGVHGRKLKVLTLDDAYDPKRTAQNVRQLIEQDNAFALFNLSGTPTVLAALPILTEHKVPLVAPFTGSDALRKNFSRYVFNVRASYADEIDQIVRHLATVQLSKVGVAYFDNPFGQGGLGAARAAAKKYGISVAAVAPLQADGTGLDAAVTAIVQERPAAIIMATAGKITSDFIAAYLRAGPGTQFYALSVISSQQLIRDLGDRSRGVAIAQVMPYPWGGATSVARELTEMARTKAATDVTYNHMEGFISAKVLVEGLRRAGKSLTRDSFIRGLESMREVDLGGYVVRFSDHSHNGSSYVELSVVSGSGRILR